MAGPKKSPNARRLASFLKRLGFGDGTVFVVVERGVSLDGFVYEVNTTPFLPDDVAVVADDYIFVKRDDVPFAQIVIATGEIEYL